MTEQEWLTSTDPAAMLAHVRGKLSPRKLRLFACVCARQSWSTLDDHGRRAVVHCEGIVESSLPWDPVQGGDENWDLWRIAHLVGDKRQSLALQATLLRDICGNPWRPMTSATMSTAEALQWYDRLTPTVLAVARAAYEERGRVCEECKGHRHVPVYGPPRETHHCGVKMVERQDVGNCRDGYWPTWCPQCWWTQLPEHIGYKNCLSCYGTGRTSDGTLDSDHLAILADALEDAGCVEDVCRLCQGKGRFEGLEKKGGPDEGPQVSTIALPYTGPIDCPRCKGSGFESGSGILSHLRGPGLHVRACWALDCILGLD